MRLGISFTPEHTSPGAYAARLRELGCTAAVFPCPHTAPDAEIDAYVQACRDHDLVIAEVGAWCNPMHADRAERRRNIEFCQHQLALAEYVGARCCVNIAGTTGEQWDGGYADNYTPAIYQQIVETTQEIIDAVHPTRTAYTLEPMPWMFPDGPDTYRQLIRDIDRPGFGVHMDIVNMINCPERYFFNTRFIDTCFDTLGAHTKSCHVKDVRLQPFLTFNLKETACGEGALDIRHYAQRVQETDPDMPFLIEHLQTEEAFIKALRYVQDLITC